MAPQRHANGLRPPSPQEAARARERFSEIASRPDEGIEIAEAALWLAAESCAGLDVEAERERIAALASEAGTTLSEDSTREERIEAINHTLFVAHGFKGERVDYYDPANSFLNRVLERKCGIPISLCVLYVTVARENGLRADGVSFPGHFLAKISPNRVPGAAGGDVLIDAFEGREITERECRAHLRTLFGPGATLGPEMLRAAPNKEILLRMLSNLKSIFANTKQLEQALACCDRALLLFPNSPSEFRDRGLIYQQLDFVRPAVTDLERYVELTPPDDAGLPPVRKLLSSLRHRLPSVH